MDKLIISVSGKAGAGKSTVIQWLTAYSSLLMGVDMLWLNTHKNKSFFINNSVKKAMAIGNSPIIFEEVLASANLEDKDEVLAYSYKIKPSRAIMFDLINKALTIEDTKSIFDKILIMELADVTLIETDRVQEPSLYEYAVKKSHAHIIVVDYNATDIDDLRDYFSKEENLAEKDRTLFVVNDCGKKFSVRNIATQLGVQMKQVYKLPYDEFLKDSAYKGKLHTYIETKLIKKEQPLDIEKLARFIMET